MIGALGVLTLPVAIVATRWSEAYTLTQSGFAIPAAAVLGIVALWLAARARRRDPLLLTEPEGSGVARLGRGLGIAALAVAASGTLALVVYGTLTWLGERGP